MVKCEAENYVCSRYQNKIICMNGTFQSPPWLILCASVLSMLLPDMHDIKIPLALMIEEIEKDVVIDKNLKVTGTIHYSYFIPEEHFKIWKKTFLVIWVSIFCLGISVSALLFYIFVNEPDVFVGASFGIVFGMTFLVGRTIFCQFKILRLYNIISLKNIN